MLSAKLARGPFAAPHEIVDRGAIGHTAASVIERNERLAPGVWVRRGRRGCSFVDDDGSNPINQGHSEQ